MPASTTFSRPKGKEKRFFFEKKKQKTFAPWGPLQARAAARSKQKFFAPGGEPSFSRVQTHNTHQTTAATR
jgi:hypothetical protein